MQRPGTVHLLRAADMVEATVDNEIAGHHHGVHGDIAGDVQITISRPSLL
jgi:hypothetical protein